MYRIALAAISTLLLLTSPVTKAFATPDEIAETVGETGSALHILVLNERSPTYDLFRGYLEVRSGGKNGSQSRYYYWGGTRCANRNLSDVELEALADAVLVRAIVTPTFTAGSPSTVRCLSGFMIKGRLRAGSNAK